MWYWLFKHVFIGPWLRVFFRLSVDGEENLPADGPAILAGNHLSFSDSLFMPLLVRRRVTFLAKQEFFTGKGIKGALKRWFMRSAGQVPIDRSSGSAAKDALETGKRVLRSGALLGIYPEGTRSPDGRLYRGKTGVARMSLEARAPVIPVAVIGTDRALPAGSVRPRLGTRIQVRFGKPLDFSRYEGMSGDRFVERSMTDEIMYELMILSGREYVDMYAAKAKADRSRGGPGGTPAVPPELREAGERTPVQQAS